MGDVRVSAIVPAAGLGLRMGGAMPKQFMLLDDRPILAHTLKRLSAHPAIGEIIVLVSPGWVDKTRKEIIDAYRCPKVRAVLEGGAERRDSVRIGLHKVGEDVQLVLIHDGVRPFPSIELIDATIAAAQHHTAAIAALPISDCIKHVDERGAVRQTVDRQGLWAAQTPQVFQRQPLMRAITDARQSQRYGYDEAELIEASGGAVQVVEGSPLNLKITSPGDLKLAEAILRKLRNERHADAADLHAFDADSASTAANFTTEKLPSRAGSQRAPLASSPAKR